MSADTEVMVQALYVGRRRRRYWKFAPFLAPVTNPCLGQTSDRCTQRLFSGEVAGVRGANVRLREMTATAAVGPQCWAMRDVSVIGSWLKSTKLPELYRIVPADLRFVAWHSGRMSVSGRRTFPVPRSTCS